MKLKSFLINLVSTPIPEISSELGEPNILRTDIGDSDNLFLWMLRLHQSD